MEAFIKSELTRCPHICMFRTRNLNNKIKRIHERALSLSEQFESFRELLDQDNSGAARHKNFKTYGTKYS